MKTVVRPPSKSTAAKALRKGVSAVRATPRKKPADLIAVTNAAIATELAPAVAIALLDKSELLPGEPAAALDVLAAGVSPSLVDGNVRVQLLFENGAVLPVEMSAAAGAALSDGLAGEVPKTRKPRRAARSKR